MKVLVGCEESQTITVAFRKRGVEAFSNDLIECSGGHPEWHLLMDVYQAIRSNDWDLIILHPPCTCLALSGNRTYGKGKPKHPKRVEAVIWTQKLWNYAISVCNHVAMENPVGVLNTYGFFPKPHYTQPYEHGHKISKKTGWWLHNLPPLKPTNIVEPEWVIHKGKRYSPDHDRYPPKIRARMRSKTYPGIAEAIADQWGGINEYQEIK
jgi:hypothetical protein